MTTYKKNFLKAVAAQIVFDRIPEIEQNPPKEFQEKFLSKYPKMTEQKSFVWKLMQKSAEEPAASSQSFKKSWLFQNTDKTKTINVESEKLTLEFTKHSNFEELIAEVGEIFTFVVSQYNLTKVNRIGLRYVNEFTFDRGNPYDWKGLLNENLYAVPANYAEGKNVMRFMQLLEMKEEDIDIRIQTGLENRERPNPIVRKEYVLDIECYQQQEIETTKIIENITKYHKTISKWFEKSIEKDLRNIMEREEK